MLLSERERPVRQTLGLNACLFLWLLSFSLKLPTTAACLQEQEDSGLHKITSFAPKDLLTLQRK